LVRTLPMIFVKMPLAIFIDKNYHYRYRKKFGFRTTHRLSDERNTTGWGKLKVQHKFIVADRSGVHISCLRHGFKKDNLVCHSLHLKRGDLVTLKNRKK